MEQTHKRGGARPNSGRPKRDSNTWGQITCILRKETIAQLRAGCGGASKHFGPFLQDHLDRHPLPDRETYEFWKKSKELRSKPPTVAVQLEIRRLEKEARDRRRAERERLKQERFAQKYPELAKKKAKRDAEIEKLLRGVMKKEKKEQARAAKAAKAAAQAAA